MSRARILRAEVWTDSRFISVSPHARLLYLGCLNVALCDRGHLNGDPQQLKWQILPADTVDGAELIEELIAAGLAARVDRGDRGFLHLVSFEQEQSASKDGRWKSRCPVCNSPELAETQASLSESVGVSPNPENFPVGEGIEGGSGLGGGGTAPSPFCSKHPNGTDAPCGACKEARLRYESADARAARTLTLGQSVPSPGSYIDQGCCKHWIPLDAVNGCTKCAPKGLES